MPIINKCSFSINILFVLIFFKCGNVIISLSSFPGSPISMSTLRFFTTTHLPRSQSTMLVCRGEITKSCTVWPMIFMHVESALEAEQGVGEISILFLTAKASLRQFSSLPSSITGFIGMSLTEALTLGEGSYLVATCASFLLNFLLS